MECSYLGLLFASAYSNYVDLITEDLSDVSDIVDETEQEDLQIAIKESLDDIRCAYISVRFCYSTWNP